MFIETQYNELIEVNNIKKIYKTEDTDLLAEGDKFGIIIEFNDAHLLDEYGVVYYSCKKEKDLENQYNLLMKKLNTKNLVLRFN